MKETFDAFALSCLLRGANTVDAHEVYSLLATAVGCLLGPIRPLLSQHLLVRFRHAPIIPQDP